jgi:hypothetical protein
MLDWYDYWHWMVDSSSELLVLVANFVSTMPTWGKVTIFGILAVVIIVKSIKIARILNHIRNIERAHIEHRLGIIEKPSWERGQKKTREVRIDDRIYHPIQQSPGGLWLHIASDKESVQNRVYPLTNLEKLFYLSVDSHNSQHRNEAIAEAAWGVVFLALLGYVIVYIFLGPKMFQEPFLMPLCLLSLFYLGFLLCGLVIGIINPKRWFLAGLIAWVAVTIGFFMLNTNLSEVADSPAKLMLLLIILPFVSAFIGSYAGKMICNKLGRAG